MIRATLLEGSRCHKLQLHCYKVVIIPSMLVNNYSYYTHEYPDMGRPKGNTKHVITIERNASGGERTSKERKAKDKKMYNKNRFKSYIGNAKEGHGFGALKKKRFINRFRRKFKKKNTATTIIQDGKSETVVIKPLANETLLEGSTVCESSTFLNETSDLSVLSDATHSSSIVSGKRNCKSIERVEIDYKKIEEERKRKYEELKANQSIHNEQISRNIEKRKKITKKLTKKTKRGQPLMANRLEHLLEKIKSK